MLTRPIRLVMRASAGARARSVASVADVWEVLGRPDRWGEFEPMLRSVTPWPADPDGPAAGRDGGGVSAGQRLRALVRCWPMPMAVDVDHVVNRSSLAVTTRLLPGLTEEVEHLVIPSASGGSVLTVRLTLHGPLAVPSLLPRWFARAVTLRLLARAAEEGLRRKQEPASSVA